MRSYAEAETELLDVLEREARRIRLPGAGPDDVMQEARIGLWKALRDFDPAVGIPFAAFATLCIRRQLISALKSATRGKHLALSHARRVERMPDDTTMPIVDLILAPESQSPEHYAIGREEEERLATFVGSGLSHLERRAVAMLSAGISYEEAAAAAGVSEKSIDNAVQRARHKITDHMGIAA